MEQRKIMKLKLEDLAPYLPYYVRGIITVDKPPFLQSGDPVHLSADILKVFLDGTVKPILKPLSNLTEEYRKNDESEIAELCDEFSNYDIEHLENGINFGDSPVDFMQYHKVVLLLEKHYDIFGLIDKGLAVDFNTL